MNLVVGATGMVGAEVCRLLTAEGRPVRALVRAATAAPRRAELAGMGVEVAPGDLRDAATLEVACRGVDTVICTASSMPFAYSAGENTPQATDADGVLNLVEAARSASVRQFIYVSFPPMAASFPLQDAKRSVEAHLRASGLGYTVLRPTFFMEIWLSPVVGFDHAGRKAVIYGSGDNAISWISYLDVARFAIASIGSRAALDMTLDLGGPTGVSPLDAVRLFEDAGQRPFAVTNVPVQALQQQLAAATDPMQRSLAGLMLGYAGTGAIDMTAVLDAFPLELRTVESYARSVMS